MSGLRNFPAGNNAENISSDDDEAEKHKLPWWFGKKFKPELFENGTFVMDAKPPPINMDDLKHLDGADLLNATVMGVLMAGLRKLAKLRHPRPREWLAFYLLCEKGEEGDSSKTTTQRPNANEPTSANHEEKIVS